MTIEGVTDHSYDYIICGGGTSGCVVAARLAEDTNARILLIEAGSHNKDLENVHMVGGWSQNFDGPQDWNLETTTQPSAHNRTIKLSRGRFLGGSSGVNGTLAIRGNETDYNSWNLPGWSGPEFFAAMRRSETFHPKPWFKAAENAHGTSGPLHIEPHDMAPISEKLLESFESQGFPLVHDMFTTGEVSHGCGHAPRTVYKGTRTTGADFVTNDQHKANITILVDTVVDKVNFEKTSTGALRAYSVDTVSSDGTKSTVSAGREIIVSGGAYCSPPILLRSGIGPKDELSKHGIECLVDSPGVGKNLMDHLIVFAFYETEPGLSTDAQIYHGDAMAQAYSQYKKDKAGFLSTFPFGAFAYARLDERMKDCPEWTSTKTQPGRDPMGLTKDQPNIEFFATECYGGPKQYNQFPVDGKHCFAMITELFAPRSRGTVTLKSKDPLDNPVVDHNYLSDPLDVAVLAEGCALGNEIVTKGAGTKDVVKGSWPSDLTHHTHTKREDWTEFVKEWATTCYHPGGTCRMGNEGDEDAVLDEKLRVRGVEGLRVADCSVMPTLNCGHTQMPAYGIGERCADFLREVVEGKGS